MPFDPNEIIQRNPLKKEDFRYIKMDKHPYFGNPTFKESKGDPIKPYNFGGPGRLDSLPGDVKEPVLINNKPLIKDQP